MYKYRLFPSGISQIQFINVVTAMCSPSHFSVYEQEYAQACLHVNPFMYVEGKGMSA